MKELMCRVDKVVNFELKRANEIFPQFHSRHEGLGVIHEEFTEVKDEFDELCDLILDVEYGVCRDRSTDHMKETLKQTKLCASLLACEAIQTAALAEKFIALMDNENSVSRIETMTADMKRELIYEEAKKRIDSITDDALNDATSATVVINVKGGK